MNYSLVNFRNSLGLTQQEMAKYIGSTLSHYSKIELGIRNPSYNFLVKFKEKFSDAKIDEIFFNNHTHVL
ncbi:helix-turn-helix transcriptional regulator [Clostridioides difficile]